ncbi:MAG: ion transporter [Acidimicrobiales bacterium]|jgi:voltage-gated potassium channel
MAEPAGTPVRQGQPRSPEDAAFLERFDAAFRLPIIISAVLPLIVAPEPGKIVSVVIGIVTWLVFLVDYVVHLRRSQHFGRTAFGRFDLVIVIATAPWFLLPGAHGGSFVVLLRLARLGRIIMASKGSRQLFQRLGRVGAFAGGVLITASLVAYYAEHPTNPEFATVGDALWWGIVTMTTVGYGDIVPKTPTGRWAAVVIMLTGVAVLGLLAGSLASFFKIGKAGPEGDEAGDDGGPVPDADSATALGALVAEVASLRQQVALLSERIADMADPSGQVSPATGADET